MIGYLLVLLVVALNMGESIAVKSNVIVCHVVKQAKGRHGIFVKCNSALTCLVSLVNTNVLCINTEFFELFESVLAEGIVAHG